MVENSENSFLDFKAFAQEHMQQLESMREAAYAKYRVRLITAIIFGAIIIVTAGLLVNAGYIGAVVAAIIVVLAFILLSLSVVQVIMTYRRSSWNLRGNYSLKEAAFNKLFGYFGDYSYSNLTDAEDLTTKGVSPERFHNCPHIPQYHVYRAEDYIRGTYRDAKVEISEAEMILQDDGRQICIFRGLIVSIDIDEIDIKLRGKFDGKGVLIADAKKDSLSTQQLYKEYASITLPEAYKNQFEAYATDEAAAQHLFTPVLFERLNAMQAMVNNTSEQNTHKDEQLHWLRAQTSNRLLQVFEKLFMGVYFLSRVIKGMLFERVNYIKLLKDGVNVRGVWTHNHRVDEVNYEHITDSNKFADHVSYAVTTLNNNVECSFFDDKFLITIPHPHDLFEPNSLFEPVLNHEDVNLVYELMHTVQDIVAHVCDAKDTLNDSVRYN
ncbi:MAG: DUF3137 domain-containing protein [Alphaproteobacteria bacterium]|nr:DUF3137 domain-containing protein [Alphaproteobacteria bacterium]